MAEKVHVSRRDFLRGSALAAATVAGGAAFAGCASNDAGSAGAASSSAAAEEASSAAAATEEAGGAQAAASGYDVLGTSYSDFGRTGNPDAKRYDTPEEYIVAKGDGVLAAGGGCEALGISPADFMLNVPAWLGEKPELEAEVEDSCDVLVIGAGNAGSVAALRCAEAGLNVILAEMQTYEEYDEYACDMACYNSKLFLDKGTPEVDPMDVFNEYMRLYRGHAHQKLVRDYATRSGEMLDWMLGYIPEELTERYAKTFGYKGNANFNGNCNGQWSWPAMTQWRDDEMNINMWPYVIRFLHDALEEKGGKIAWGYQGITLVGGNGAPVTGAIFKDIEGNYKQIDAKVVLACAGDWGGNPDMRIDLSDQMRNLAWSFGNDRTDAAQAFGMGRDGSGIRMCMWAGATMEAGPRAGQSAGINGKPGLAFGGCYPVFGNDGKRFMNEAAIKHGSNGFLDMLPDGFNMVSITDSNWEEYLTHQGYGHETMDTSSDLMMETVRQNMAEYKTGPDGFQVRAFSRFGIEYSTVYAADTIEEVAEIAGYTGEAAANLVEAVARWNEMCEKGHDDDWGIDPQMLLPIKDAPFFFSFGSTGGGPSGGLCQHAAVCTDENYNVLYGDKTPIEGLYAAGNNCGQRYGIQYATPTAGNSCGSALTSGFCAADAVVAALG